MTLPASFDSVGVVPILQYNEILGKLVELGLLELRS